MCVSALTACCYRLSAMQNGQGAARVSAPSRNQTQVTRLSATCLNHLAIGLCCSTEKTVYDLSKSCHIT